MFKSIHNRSGFANVKPEREQLNYGILPLSSQISAMRRGGVSLSTRQLGDGNYDEDDSEGVDPSINDLDRFERLQAITDTISERIAKRDKDKLDHAEV